MLYQLKKGQESFTAVEGPLAGRSFAPGKVYDEIPPGMAGKFDEIKKAAPAAGAEVKPAPRPPAKAESRKPAVAAPPAEKDRGGKS